MEMVWSENNSHVNRSRKAPVFLQRKEFLMEKVKIGDKELFYDIQEILPINTHVLRIVFANSLPASYGDITTYTAGGIEGVTLTGYDTVYRDEGKTVYLSNDKSVYIPVETSTGPMDPPEPYTPTLEELKASKRREISAACEKAIYEGVDIKLADGTIEHYSLTEHDQLNLFGKQIQVSAGVEKIEYHSDGRPCRYYDATDMQTIISVAMWHVSYHTTYCNALNIWISGIEQAGDLKTISYGVEVPEAYQSDVLKAYLIQKAAMTEGVRDETAS